MKLSLGEKVRNLREDKDLNQTQLGKAVGMTQRKLSYIECGKCEPSVDDIVALCNFFKVSADYLLGLTESKKPSPRIGFLREILTAEHSTEINIEEAKRIIDDTLSKEPKKIIKVGMPKIGKNPTPEKA